MHHSQWRVQEFFISEADSIFRGSGLKYFYQGQNCRGSAQKHFFSLGAKYLIITIGRLVMASAPHVSRGRNILIKISAGVYLKVGICSRAGHDSESSHLPFK